MGQPGTVIIAFVINKHLGLVFQFAERGSVDDPVAVALEPSAVGMLVLRVGPAPAFPAFDGKWSQIIIFQLLNVLTFDHCSYTPKIAIFSDWKWDPMRIVSDSGRFSMSIATLWQLIQDFVKVDACPQTVHNCRTD